MVVQIKSARELTAYKKAYALAMEIFELSKSFPREEQYSLTSQIRRSSRSVWKKGDRPLLPERPFGCCAQKGPVPFFSAWAKRRYEAHFMSKLTDCDGENGETDTSLDFAHDCGYITDQQHNELLSKCEEVGKMLGAMINNPAPFLLPHGPLTPVLCRSVP